MGLDVNSFTVNPGSAIMDAFTADVGQTLLSALGTTTNGDGNARNFSVGIKRAVTNAIDWLSQDIAIANNAAGAVIPAAVKVGINAGDTVVCRASGQTAFQRINPAGAFNTGLIIAAPDGMTFLQFGNDGNFYISKDGQATWQNIGANPSPGLGIIGWCFFAGKFRLYINENLGVTVNLDGTGIANVALTNGPTACGGPAINGKMLVVAGKMYALNVPGGGTTRLVETTDGVAWTVTGNFSQNGVSLHDLGHDGTNFYIGIRNQANWLYRSPTGATGTWVNGGNVGMVLSPTYASQMAAVPGIVIAICHDGNGSYYYYASKDSGATWTSFAQNTLGGIPVAGSWISAYGGRVITKPQYYLTLTNPATIAAQFSNAGWNARTVTISGYNTAEFSLAGSSLGYQSANGKYYIPNYYPFDVDFTARGGGSITLTRVKVTA